MKEVVSLELTYDEAALLCGVFRLGSMQMTLGRRVLTPRHVDVNDPVLAQALCNKMLNLGDVVAN